MFTVIFGLHHLHYHHLHLLVLFQSELKSSLFGKSFPPGLIPLTLGPFNDFTLLSGWIFLHGVID